MDLVDANGDDERLSRFLDAEHDARQVDMRVVARDVSEHEAEGQHLAADEPMGGLEADAIFTDIHRGPGPMRGLYRKPHVVPRRPSAFHADGRGRCHAFRTGPSHSPVRLRARAGPANVTVE